MEIRSSLHPDPFAQRALRRFGDKNNQLQIRSYDQFCSNLLVEYENNGYPFARINIDSVEISDRDAVALLVIQAGNRIRIDSIMNRTGYRISGPVINRIIDISPGDVYNEFKIQRASRRISDMSFFKETRSMEVGFYENRANLFFYPDKKQANRFDGWIGFAPGGILGSGITFAGSVDLELNNLLAQAENWQVMWKRNQDRSQKMRMKMDFPYFLGLPVGIEGSLDIFRQDSSYLNLEWEAGLPYHFQPNHRLYAFFRSRESTLLTAQPFTDLNSRLGYNLWLSGLSWNLNTLDNQINPSRGLSLRAEVSTGQKEISGSDGSIRQSELQSDASFYIGLAKRFTLGTIIQSGYKLTPVTLENEQFRLGGVNRLRGFDEDSFYADAFCVSSFELRFLLDSYSHLLIFTDMAVSGRLHPSGWQTVWPFSFGLGGQIRTGGGILKILFALGSASDWKLDLRSGKIHFGYIGIF